MVKLLLKRFFSISQHVICMHKIVLWWKLLMLLTRKLLTKVLLKFNDIL